MHQMTSAELTTRWTRWAKQTVADNSDPRRCSVSFCAERDSTAFDRMLWPGYIGESYSEGRVLLVGGVHNAGQLRTNEMVALADFAEKWAVDELSDNDTPYVDLIRQSYLTSAQRIWIRERQVWGLLDDIVEKLGLSWKQIAFTNWNKCKSPTTGLPGTKDEQKKEQARLYLAHIDAPEAILKRLPITELEPVALFICCGIASVVDSIRTANLQTRIVRVFDQPSVFNRFAPPSKFPKKQDYPAWLDEDTQRYKLIAENGFEKPFPLN